MKLRDYLSKPGKYTIEVKRRDGVAVEMILKRGKDEPVTYELYGHVTAPKE